MDIQAMLNPVNEEMPFFSPAASVNGSPSIPRSSVLPALTSKPEKMSKDGFLPVKGVPKSPITYGPFELRNDPDIGRHLNECAVLPSTDMGLFREFPRYIPYSSSKKDFLEKTGRRGFETFQYEFRAPDQEGKPKKHLVLWDYQVGSVRITPFFKALNYAKTTPNQAVKSNPGLEELTVSITGGSLAAQGYWMPFECARAMAATFCYKIRHVLAPIFGKEFLDQCLHPEDRNFGRFKVDEAIIRACKADMVSWKTRFGLDTPRSLPASSISPGSSPTSQKTVFSTPLLHRSVHTQHHNPFSPLIDTGYQTDQISDSGISGFCGSPEISPRTVMAGFTPINRVSRPPEANKATRNSRTPSPGQNHNPIHIGTPPRSVHARKRGAPIPRSIKASPKRVQTFTERGSEALGKIKHLLIDDDGPKAKDKLRRFPPTSKKVQTSDEPTRDQIISNSMPEASPEAKAAAAILLAMKNKDHAKLETAVNQMYIAVGMQSMGTNGTAPVSSNEQTIAAAMAELKARPFLPKITEQSASGPLSWFDQTGLGIQFPVAPHVFAPPPPPSASAVPCHIVSPTVNERARFYEPVNLATGVTTPVDLVFNEPRRFKRPAIEQLHERKPKLTRRFSA